MWNFIFCLIDVVLLFHWLPCTLNQISPAILLTTRNYLLDDVSLDLPQVDCERASENEGRRR